MEQRIISFVGEKKGIWVWGYEKQGHGQPRSLTNCPSKGIVKWQRGFPSFFFDTTTLLRYNAYTI